MSSILISQNWKLADLLNRNINDKAGTTNKEQIPEENHEENAEENERIIIFESENQSENQSNNQPDTSTTHTQHDLPGQ